MRWTICLVLSVVLAMPASANAPPVAGSETAPSTGAATLVRTSAGSSPPLRPVARKEVFPRMRWDHRRENALWTRAALAAVKGHGAPLIELVPADVMDWCPAYPENGPDARAAFWVGFMSALSKHESTYKPQAVGGGGKWYGLLQISPATARGYGCRAGSGAALKSGPANLSCGTRIMAATVSRDGVIHASEPRWSGISADWGPMRSPAKRRDMARWLKSQSYCKPMSALRPRSRP